VSFNPSYPLWAILQGTNGEIRIVPDDLDLQPGDRFVRRGITSLSQAERIAARLARQAADDDEGVDRD
jgi:ABC-type branched-subunit amino acid transport system ATPase component